MIFILFLLFPWFASSQFPAVCNSKERLDTKMCCPNNCSGPTRGTCKNITAEVAAQWEVANRTVTKILRDAPDEAEKGSVDARYLWPTIVFERVCECKGNYGGVDCSKCDFGWTGSNCNERKRPVVRRSFGRLTPEEKEAVVSATKGLKDETGYWSVIVEEPLNYTFGRVKLQNVSTYDFFIYLHNYVARANTACTKNVNRNVYIDFAHSGPVFPVWHRHYILVLEREFQRYLNNDSFGFPYWQWEEHDLSPFDTKYYGVPSNAYGYDSAVNVTGKVINNTNWNTICDIAYWQNPLSCENHWKLCNPASDLANARPLQRGYINVTAAYLPNRDEVKIAIAAPSYDAAGPNRQYFRNCPRSSFRCRLEGWNIICSADICVGSRQGDIYAHMHNLVHDWVGGQMDVVPAAVNDPIFNFHHCNVDRILESWMQRFEANKTNQGLLPAYVPVSGGHPGHNRDDYIVPFFPLMKAGDQYKTANVWGYTYDELIPASIADYDISDCSVTGNCSICAANTTCLACAPNQTCPVVLPTSTPPMTGANTEGGVSSLGLELGLGLGLGIPLVVVSVALITLVIVFIIVKIRISPARLNRDLDLTKLTLET